MIVSIGGKSRLSFMHFKRLFICIGIDMHPYFGSFVMKPSESELAIAVPVILGLYSHYLTQPLVFDSSLSSV